MGGDADIDNFLKTTRSNVQDLEAAVVQLKAKAVQALFDTTFINGNASTNASAFRLSDRGKVSATPSPDAPKATRTKLTNPIFASANDTSSRGTSPSTRRGARRSRSPCPSSSSAT